MQKRVSSFALLFSAVLSIGSHAQERNVVSVPELVEQLQLEKTSDQAADRVAGE